MLALKLLIPGSVPVQEIEKPIQFYGVNFHAPIVGRTMHVGCICGGSPRRAGRSLSSSQPPQPGFVKRFSYQGGYLSQASSAAKSEMDRACSVRHVGLASFLDDRHVLHEHYRVMVAANGVPIDGWSSLLAGIELRISCSAGGGSSIDIGVSLRCRRRIN